MFVLSVPAIGATRHTTNAICCIIWHSDRLRLRASPRPALVTSSLSTDYQKVISLDCTNVLSRCGSDLSGRYQFEVALSEHGKNLINYMLNKFLVNWLNCGTLYLEGRKCLYINSKWVNVYYHIAKTNENTV